MQGQKLLFGGNGAQLLFSIARLHPRPSQDSTEVESSGHGHASSNQSRQTAALRSKMDLYQQSDASYEDDEGEGTASDTESSEDLAKINCGICRRSLLPSRSSGGKDGQRRAWDSKQDLVMSSHVKICDGCHQSFHASCCRRKFRGQKVKDGLLGSAWYCSQTCQEQRTGLLTQCLIGDAPVTSTASSNATTTGSQITAGITHRYRYKSDDEPSTESGTSSGSQRSGSSNTTSGPMTWQVCPGDIERGSAQWKGLKDAHVVLGLQYGPFVLHQMQGSDWVAVLRQGGQPVSALTMDCYGDKGCIVDLAATHPDNRMQGHMRTLVDTVHQFLARSAATSQLLTVVNQPRTPEGRTASDIWQRHFGFSRLSNRQVHSLQAELQTLAMHGTDVCMFRKQWRTPGAENSTPSHARSGLAVFLTPLRVPQQLVHRLTGKHSTSSVHGRHSPGRQSALMEGAKDSSTTAGRLGSQQGHNNNNVEDDGQEGGVVKRPKVVRSYWRFKLWGWAVRRAVKASTFGLIG